MDALYRGYYGLGGTIGMIGTPASESNWRATNLGAAAVLLLVALLPLEQDAPRRARQMPGCGCKQRPISGAELWPRDLTAQDLELVAQHQQLDVIHMQAASATNERTEQSPHGEVEEGEGHTADPPSPGLRRRDTNFGRPSRAAKQRRMTSRQMPFGRSSPE